MKILKHCLALYVKWLMPLVCIQDANKTWGEAWVLYLHLGLVLHASYHVKHLRQCLTYVYLLTVLSHLCMDMMNVTSNAYKLFPLRHSLSIYSICTYCNIQYHETTRYLTDGQILMNPAIGLLWSLMSSIQCEA